MEEKSGGLEIVSIGKLYSGPWDKKYWSSTRGKDRYPYPVGYKALRNQNGVTYKLEILEGLKGPLFSISSIDGQSYSGQTPDMAWECFQKKGCPRIKSLPGKRFSCKIDGVEFFGFKNASVQRLLKELVADVTETAEKLPPASHSHNNMVLETNNPSQSIETEITGKRSRREKINSYNNTGLKKQRYGKKQGNSDASHSICKKHEPVNSTRVLSGSVRLESILQNEEKQVSKEDSSQLVSLNIKDHPKACRLFPQDENEFSTHAIQPPLEEVGVLHKDGNLFDRSEVLKAEVRGNPFVNEDNEGTLVTNDLHVNNDMDLDTHNNLDHQTDDSFNLASTSGKDGMSSHDTVIPDVLRTRSHKEEELEITYSNLSSSKSEFEQYPREIAKSILSILLPEPPSLIKTFSRKKRNNAEPQGRSLCMSKEENKSDPDSITRVSKLSANSNLEMEEKIEFAQGGHASDLSCRHVESIVPDSLDHDEGAYVPDTELPESCEIVGHVESIVPDSLDNDEGAYVPDPELPESSEIVEADKSFPALDTKLHEKTQLPDIVDSEEGSLVCNDFQMNLCANPKDMRSSDTSMACKTTLVTALMENVTNTINICGAVSSENVSIVEPMLENVPLSESIICREFRDDSTAEVFAKASSSSALHTSQGYCQTQEERNLFGNEQKNDPSLLCPHVDDRATNIDGVLHDASPLFQNQENSRILDGKHNSDAHPTNSCQEIFKLDAAAEHLRDKNCVTSLSYMQNERNDTSGGLSEKQLENNGSIMDIENSKSKLKGALKIVACYVHPEPVSMVLVTTTEKEVHICVLSGPNLQKGRKLYLYKAPIMGEDEGHPSFVGYTSLMLPFGRDIELDSSALQFSPYGQYLLLLNCIKVPCCRKGDVNCRCSACASDLHDNAVKIMQIKAGYASVIARLQSTKSVRCILACMPHHLIAADNSGTLYIWVMDSKWREKTDECFVQSPSCMTPLTRLKRIPNLVHLVLGLNGFGEFSLWDINRRVLVSKFSSPHTSVFQCVPLSLFTWKARCNILQDLYIEEVFNEVVDATKASFSGKGDTDTVCYLEGDEVGVWLLVSTTLGSDKAGYQSSDLSDPVRCWKLALLAKNTVIMGDVLEPRASAVGASGGHGIIGRSDGHVYLWDFITGTKLGSLHHFKDGSVSSIATDDSQTGALAIANDGGQLLVYLPS
ncbi:unnamed protein product [Cuscuta campestris]|uniref:FYR C-terminal domain-containing protein n=1 Tax=Cuscuta campestris TaxID=132261 RepID=A0A484KRQ0_9ASTE|nr:unnamed protein product [Cuscuta campestris]